MIYLTEKGAILNVSTTVLSQTIKLHRKGPIKNEHMATNSAKNPQRIY
jgi:hypothetical protein